MLAPVERVALRVAEAAHGRLGRALTTAWNLSVVSGMLWLCSGRRTRVRGLHHLAPFGPSDSVVLVANHRSFFDFFVITGVLHWRTRLCKQRVLFPVRAPFFYDHPMGIIANAALSGMRMYPPILRDRKRAVFNRYTVARCVQELQEPGTILGLHPEGTRNKGTDPYALLPGQPGVGRVLVEAAGATVIPVFVHGLSNDLMAELTCNWTAPHERPIDVVFGAPVPLSDVRVAGSRPASHRSAVQRCMEAIAALGEQHRATREGAPDGVRDAHP